MWRIRQAAAIGDLAYNPAFDTARTTGMLLHADFSEAVTLDTLSLPWVASPDGSVRRRMLDRIGDEVARATSIVRYPPGSRFPPHGHELGEEFLVLDGVFSDEHGDFPPGTYVRNPPGSAHSPRSDEGCTIFVKLRQMPPQEDRHIRVETGNASWRPWRGLDRLDLFDGGYETVFMVESGDASVRVEPEPAAGFEALVLAGSIATNGAAHGPMAWLRRPSTAGLSLTLAPGTRIWIKTGHLSG